MLAVSFIYSIIISTDDKQEEKAYDLARACFTGIAFNFSKVLLQNNF